MSHDWDCMTEDTQIALSREALCRAAVMIALQAEALAREMECGTLADRGGPDALRLFAAVVRVSGNDDMPAMGHG
jgi:hypothetical protein